MDEIETTTVAAMPTEGASNKPGSKRSYRRRRERALVKIEAAAAPKESEKPARVQREIAMPDARWLAEFVTALLASRR